MSVDLSDMHALAGSSQGTRVPPESFKGVCCFFLYNICVADTCMSSFIQSTLSNTATTSVKPVPSTCMHVNATPTERQAVHNHAFDACRPLLQHVCEV